MSTSNPRVILVTGANRGIGFSIIQSLATHPVTRDSVLLLGCRDPVKGHEAVAELLSAGVNGKFHTITLDVTSDESIRTAFTTIETKFGRLDVLVNNAGYAALTSAPDFSDYRRAWASTFDVNITSATIMMQVFLPLLRKSARGGKIINISSARGSLSLNASDQLPPTVAIAYSASKTALNLVTVELSRQAENKQVEFQLACPGHCKTAFNNFRGSRDPLEGANVVIELIVSARCTRKNTGSWETKGDSKDVTQVPW